MFNYWVSFGLGFSSDSLVVIMLPALLELDGLCRLLGFNPVTLLMWMLLLRPADRQEPLVRADNQESNNFFLDSFDTRIHVPTGPRAECQRRRWRTFVSSKVCLTYLKPKKGYHMTCEF